MKTEQEEIEREFAEGVLEENKDVLEQLTGRMGGYAEQGRSDKMYVLTKAVLLVMRMSQARMKQTLGLDQGKMN